MSTIKTSLAEKWPLDSCWWLRSIKYPRGYLTYYDIDDTTPVFVDAHGFPTEELFVRAGHRTKYNLSVLCKI